MATVGLIGLGYLGGAYHEHMFPEAVTYDEPKIVADAHKLEQETSIGQDIDALIQAGRAAINGCDLAIIAVPTDYDETGELDMSTIEDIARWVEVPMLFKSALQPGTVDKLKEKFPDKQMAVSVEYIGEGNYYQPPEKYPDPRNPKLHRLLVIGGEEPVRSLAAEILWQQMSPDTRIHLVTALEAEITKMAENTYGALKVTWANVLRDICDKYGANFIQVHQAWSEDGRVDPMHTRSVAHQRGWNSKCYNKDVRAFANISGSAMLQGLVDDNERHLGMNEQQEMTGARDATES